MAEHNQMAVRRPTGLSKPQPPLSNESRIVLALAEMAIKRGGEMSQIAQEIVAQRLSTENFDDVIRILSEIGDTPRREHEPVIPDTGTILLAVRSLKHPHRHLREIVTKLALIFGVTADEELLELYQQEAGHRTDEDLDKAFAAIRGDETLKKFPTPGAFRSACGIPKIYRDGSRPE